MPVGKHILTVAKLRQLCVDRFPLSRTRATIMLGLEQIVDRLRASHISGELWVDGSFLTDKINPNDSDVVLFIQQAFCDNATVQQKEAIKWINSNLKSSHCCDSYVSIEYPPSHPLYWEGEYLRAYWMRQWGFSTDDAGKVNMMKGIAVISL